MNGRIVVAAVVLLGGLGVAVAGANPQSTLTPTQAVDHAPGEASVKGMVESIDADNHTFQLTDESTVIAVSLKGTLPAAIQEGKALVAEGQLVDRDGERVLLAEEIQLGCPSKYEA